MSSSEQAVAVNSYTDEQLMEAFRCKGDRHCIDVLVHRYSGKAIGAAFTFTHDHSDAQDAVQDAFVNVVRRSHQYRGDMPFAPWFFRILRNVCLDLLRRRKTHARAMENIDIPENESPVPDERVRHIASLTAQLPPADRQVLSLRIIAGLQLSEIAGICSCSEEAAKKRAQRALAHLRDLVEKSGLLSGSDLYIEKRHVC